MIEGEVQNSENVVLIKDGNRKDMSLADAIRAFLQLPTLGDRLACSIIRKGTPMLYSEIVRVAGRRDFQQFPR